MFQVLHHVKGFALKVPGLVLFMTRQDWRTLPELARLWQDYFCLVPLLRNFWKNLGILQDGTGLLRVSLLSTIQEKSQVVLNVKTFPNIEHIICVQEFLTTFRD